MKANLGCGADIILGWDNVDAAFKDEANSPSWTVGLDVVDYLNGLPDDYLEEVKAHHILEHISDLDMCMKSLHRVCKNGAKIDIVVPLANTLWDVANPDHKRRFNHKTFLYYTRDFVTSDLGLFRGYDLLDMRVERDANEWFGGVEWIVANLHVKLLVRKD